MRSELCFLSGFSETRKGPQFEWKWSSFEPPGLPDVRVLKMQKDYGGTKQSSGQERASTNSKSRMTTYGKIDSKEILLDARS
jgi:hypothetical protein